MSDVQSFVNGRWQNTVDPWRQAAADQLRASVPATSLTRADSNPMDNKPNVAKAKVPPSSVKRKQSNRQRRSGFDTDAESIDDTRVSSTSAKDTAQERIFYRRAEGNGNYDATTLRSRTRHNGPQDHGTARKFDAETDASELSNVSSSEGDEEDHSNGQAITNIFENQLQNPAFVIYRKQLESSGAAAGRPALIKPSRRAQRVARRLPLESPTSGGRTTNPRFQRQPFDAQERDESLSTAHIVPAIDAIQYEDAPVETTQRHLTTGGVEKVHPLPSRPSQPLPATERSTADPASMSTRTDTANEKLVTQNKIPAAALRLKNGSFSVSNLSNNHARTKVQDSEAARGSLRRKRPRDLDHSQDQLSSMTFEQLRAKSFDLRSTLASTVLPQELTGAPLPIRLEHLLDLVDMTDQDDRQQAFFDSLTIERHAGCGDTLAKGFSVVIAKLCDTRQQKRKLAREFEEQIAKREEFVRVKSADLAQDRESLKQNGSGMLKGRATQP